MRLQRTALRNTVCIPDVPEVDRKGMLDPKMKCIITSWRAASDPVTLFEPHYKRATPHRRSRCKAFPAENMICTDGKDAVFYRMDQLLYKIREYGNFLVTKLIFTL